MTHATLKDELLSDEQLDNVTGGNAAEIQDDANKLRQLGVLGAEKVDQFQVRAAFLKLPICPLVGAGKIAFGYYGIDYPNEYKIRNSKGDYTTVDRKFFWEFVFNQMQKF